MASRLFPLTLLLAGGLVACTGSKDDTNDTTSGGDDTNDTVDTHTGGDDTQETGETGGETGETGETGFGGTGLGELYLVGAGGANAGDGSFAGGYIGYYFAGQTGADCMAVEAWNDTNATPHNCPDCDWTFNLSANGAASATGDLCSQLGFTGSEFDGLTYDVGFAENFYYYGYTFDQAGVFYFEGTGFAPIFYNYNGDSYTVTMITGDASYSTWQKDYGQYAY